MLPAVAVPPVPVLFPVPPPENPPPPVPPVCAGESDTQDAIFRSPVFSANQTLMVEPTFISAIVPCFPLDAVGVLLAVVGVAAREDPIHALCPPPGAPHLPPPGNPPAPLPPRPVLIRIGTPTGIVTSTSIFLALARASWNCVIRA